MTLQIITTVDKAFGSLDDLKELIHAAHERRYSHRHGPRAESYI